MGSKTVLITGATGFLGGALQAHEMTRDDTARYLLMVRAQSDAAARERLEARLMRFVGPRETKNWLDRCSIVRADLEDPESFEQPIFDEVTHVVHAGANTSFLAGPRVWNANSQGTLALARRLERAPRLTRCLYVGTAMICGDDPPEVVREDDYPRENVQHFIDYTASKAAAEAALRETLGPWIVARPSIVVGHTQLGCGPSGSIFWVFRALDHAKLISVDPATTGIDVVPVDWVAGALSHLTHAPELRHRTYHLSAGEGTRTKLDQLMRAFAHAQGMPYDPNAFTRIASEEIHKYRGRLAEAFGKLHGRRMELALGLYLGFCELNVVFDNGRILSEGVKPPLSLTEYVAACLSNPKDMDIVRQADDEL